MTTLDTSAGLLTTTVARDGWWVTPPCLPQLTLDQLIAELETTAPDPEVRGGVRYLLTRSTAVRALAVSRPVRDVAEAVLGPHCFVVRATLFDRMPTAHRRVTWHQDLTVAVKRRERVDGYGPWSEDAGVPNAEAPAELLEGMLTLRVHLDDCGMENGPVRVLPGSHRVGRLSGAAIDAWRGAVDPVYCTAERGAIHVMRPLLLHASSPATSPARRRVVHLEFANEDLPGSLEWHDELS